MSTSAGKSLDKTIEEANIKLEEITFYDAKKALDTFIKEVNLWVKEHSLTELPEYNKLVNKVILGTHYRKDQIYFEKITKFKSTFFSLQAFFTSMESKADREYKRLIETTLSQISQKIREMDTLLEAGKHRLQFYKTVVYMVGNVIYGIE